jgi:hypothetical protein
MTGGRCRVTWKLLVQSRPLETVVVVFVQLPVYGIGERSLLIMVVEIVQVNVCLGGLLPLAVLGPAGDAMRRGRSHRVLNK